MHVDRRLQAEGVFIAGFPGQVAGGGIGGDIRYLGPLGDGRNGKRERRQCAADHADDLLFADQTFGALLRPLRVRLVQPDDLSRPSQQRVVALLKRQHAALSEIFRLIDDRAGLGPDHSDLDGLCCGRVTDVGHAKAGCGERRCAQ